MYTDIYIYIYIYLYIYIEREIYIWIYITSNRTFFYSAPTPLAAFANSSYVRFCDKNLPIDIIETNLSKS